MQEVTTTNIPCTVLQHRRHWGGGAVTPRGVNQGTRSCVCPGCPYARTSLREETLVTRDASSVNEAEERGSKEQRTFQIRLVLISGRARRGSMPHPPTTGNCDPGLDCAAARVRVLLTKKDAHTVEPAPMCCGERLRANGHCVVM